MQQRFNCASLYAAAVSKSNYITCNMIYISSITSYKNVTFLYYQFLYADSTSLVADADALRCFSRCLQLLQSTQARDKPF